MSSTVELHDELHKYLTEVAAEGNWTLSHLVERLIFDGITYNCFVQALADRGIDFVDLVESVVGTADVGEATDVVATPDESNDNQPDAEQPGEPEDNQGADG